MMYPTRYPLRPYPLDVEQTVIVCANIPSMDAGAIISRILEIDGKQYLDDLARTALTLYDSYKDDLRAPLAGCAHVQRLKALGMEKDIDFCLQEDIMDVVPCYLDGVIRNAYA